MRIAPHRSDPWAPYSPSASAPWDLLRVVHLHRRAGFGATRTELARDLSDGPEAAIARILSGQSRRSGVPVDFDRLSALIADAAVQTGDLRRLQAWWVYRLLFSPDPLGERLTLLWHNHFATGFEKVRDLRAMHRQNETLRQLARTRFGDLLDTAIRDPALLIYLDATTNPKDRPNENLAREVMELFTLGVGHYSESDVRAAARALTGLTLGDGGVREQAAEHDDGVKTILGKAGPWGVSHLAAILADHPATARRLAARLCDLLMGEGAVDDPAVAALAAGLRDRRLDIGWGVATILRSRAFFDPANIRTRVLGPVEFVVGACRALLPSDSPPSTIALADWISQLGQNLFDPPNVGGWPEGRGWLTDRTILARARFAGALVDGRPIGLPSPIDPAMLAEPPGPMRSCGAAADAAATLLRGANLTPRERQQRPMASAPTPEAMRQAVAWVVAAPESQIA